VAQRPDGGALKMSEETKKAPNPFDPAALRITGSLAANGGAEKLLLVMNVQKPPKQAFVRVNPDPSLRIPIALLELAEERETYAVTPAVAQQVPSEVKFVDLRLAVTQQGTLFLWPVPLPTADRVENNWSMTARTAANRAEMEWVRMTANMSAQRYEVHTSQSAAAEPVWPDKTLQELLAIAFGNGRLIDSLEHPVIQRLLGRG
jgi:hypothetical protein